MERGEGWSAVALDELEAIPWLGRGPTWRPLRHALGARIVGMNAYTAERAGEELIETHVESTHGRGHEEVYTVLRGAARFVLDERELDAPVGTFIRVEAHVRRGASALTDRTAVLALGGPPTFEPAAAEWVERARPRVASDPAGAEEIVADLRRALPGSVGVAIAQALLALGRDDRHAAAAELAGVLRREPRLRAHLEGDPDLGPTLPTLAGDAAGAGDVGPVVRAARGDDLDEVLRLLSQLHEDEPPLVPSAERGAVFARMLAAPGRTVLVAEGAATLIGTLDIRVFENLTHDARPWAEIEKVVVDRAQRGRGVGRALMDAALELAREAGCFKVQLLSRAERAEAHSFYERAGFDAPVRGFRRYL